MKMPKSFRYKSSLEQFKEATDYFLNCLQEKKAHLLYGCINDIFIDMPDDKQEINKIVKREISSFIEDALKNKFDLDDLNEYLNDQCSDDEIEDSDVQQILDLFEEKYKYVVENVISNEMFRRYYFKEKTIANKLSGVQADINKYIINEEQEIKYALIRVMVNEKLPGVVLPNEIMKLVDDKKKSVEFVCDINDLEYLIEQLEKIKRKLK